MILCISLIRTVRDSAPAVHCFEFGVQVRHTGLGSIFRAEERGIQKGRGVGETQIDGSISEIGGRRSEAGKPAFKQEAK